MSKKQLVNSVLLNVDVENPSIEISLSIPIKLSKEDFKKLKKKDNVDLGVLEFSEETSENIRKVGESIRNELLSKI